MSPGTNRRRFLALASTGTALSLAGCPAFQSDTEPTADGQDTTPGSASAQDTPETDTPETPDVAAGETETVTVAVQPDQQRLRERQRRIQSELQAGNITRAEAQQQAQTAERDLRQQALASFRERAGSTDSLSIVDTLDQFGVLLVSGSAPSLIGTLRFARVNALLPAQTFQQAKEQVQQRSQSPTPAN